MADDIQKAIAQDEAEGPYDASDKGQVNKARKVASRKKEARLRVVEALMQHEDGRRWLYEWLDICHIYGSPLVAGDTHLTYWNLGEQNVGKRLLIDIEAAAPDLYAKMLKENRTGRVQK